jgi:hypothetical protein
VVAVVKRLLCPWCFYFSLLGLWLTVLIAGGVGASKLADVIV